MRFRYLFFLSLLILALAVSCKSKYDMLLASADVPSKYKAAFDLFNDKKYKKAAAMFESLSMYTNGLPMDDTVRYYWALSNYYYHDYISAEANFASYIEFYPHSGFSEDARFLRLDCKYRATYRYELDQNPSNLAIIAISEYMMDYPQSDKIETCSKMVTELNARLDRKAFMNAKLYYDMEDYIAAKTSFKNILKDDGDNIFREEILYFIAKSNYKYAQLSVFAKQKERYMEFIDSYYNFIGEIPESRYRKDLDQLYAKAQNIVTSNGAISKEELRKQRREEKKMDNEMKKLEKTNRLGTAGTEKVKKMKLNGGK